MGRPQGEEPPSPELLNASPHKRQGRSKRIALSTPFRIFEKKVASTLKENAQKCTNPPPAREGRQGQCGYTIWRLFVFAPTPGEFEFLNVQALGRAVGSR